MDDNIASYRIWVKDLAKYFNEIGIKSCVNEIPDNIKNNVIINDNSIIGNNCRIKEGAKIGVDGFAFERNRNKVYNFPFYGNVIIKENNNEISGSKLVVDMKNSSSIMVGSNASRVQALITDN